MSGTMSGTMSGNMFSTLESTWDESARRGWTTLASFTMQAFALSLLFAVSLIWIERPPQVRWLQLTAPAAFTPPAAEQPARGHRTAVAVSNPRPGEIIAPRSIPPQIAASDDSDSVPAAPDFSSVGTGPGRGPGDGVPHSIGDGIPAVIPARPAVVKPLLLSHRRRPISFTRCSRIIRHSRARRTFRARSSCGRSSARQARSRIWSWSTDTRCSPPPRLTRSGNGAIALTC